MSNVYQSNDGGDSVKNQKNSVRGSQEFSGSNGASTKRKDTETFDGAKLVILTSPIVKDKRDSCNDVLNSLSHVEEGEESPQKTGTRSDFWQQRPRSSKIDTDVVPRKKLDKWARERLKSDTNNEEDYYIKGNPNIVIGSIGQSQDEKKTGKTGSKDTQNNLLNMNPDIGVLDSRRMSVNKDLAMVDPSKQKKSYRKPCVEEEYTFTPAKLSSYKPESVEQKISATKKIMGGQHYSSVNKLRTLIKRRM